MTNPTLSNVTLPAEKEVEAAVQGHRTLAAFLATGFETCGARQNQPGFTRLK
jgi:hypothetical protein